jgi:hypothetical protein
VCDGKAPAQEEGLLMPFKKVGPDDYVSPSGRHFTAKQVKAYYATNGFKRKPKKAKKRG